MFVLGQSQDQTGWVTLQVAPEGLGLESPGISKGEYQYGAQPSPARSAFVVHKEKLPSHCSLQFE